MFVLWFVLELQWKQTQVMPLCGSAHVLWLSDLCLCYGLCWNCSGNKLKWCHCVGLLTFCGCQICVCVMVCVGTAVETNSSGAIVWVCSRSVVVRSVFVLWFVLELQWKQTQVMPLCGSAHVLWLSDLCLCYGLCWNCSGNKLKWCHCVGLLTFCGCQICVCVMVCVGTAVETNSSGAIVWVCSRSVVVRSVFVLWFVLELQWKQTQVMPLCGSAHVLWLPDLCLCYGLCWNCSGNKLK